MLEAECRAVGVRIQTNVNVTQVSWENSFVLRARDNDDEFYAESLVVATGGLSIPKMGATGFGYDLARQFGLKIVEPQPALVPLTLNKATPRIFAILPASRQKLWRPLARSIFARKC